MGLLTNSSVSTVQIPFSSSLMQSQEIWDYLRKHIMLLKKFMMMEHQQAKHSSICQVKLELRKLRKLELNLLRDVKDTTVGTLSQRITAQLLGLKGLLKQVKHIHEYLDQVVQGKLPVNHAIVYQLQDIFNLLPDVSDHQFVKSVHTKTNDQMLVVYLASLTRSVIALHNLINNKL